MSLSFPLFSVNPEYQRSWFTYIFIRIYMNVVLRFFFKSKNCIENTEIGVIESVWQVSNFYCVFNQNCPDLYQRCGVLCAFDEPVLSSFRAFVVSNSHFHAISDINYMHSVYVYKKSISPYTFSIWVFAENIRCIW